MPDTNSLVSMGIKLPDLVSGFAGGVVNALFFQRASPAAAIASVIGGALTSNYLAAYVDHIAGTGVGLAGFLVGVTAMAICQGMFSIVNGWIDRFKAKKDAP